MKKAIGWIVVVLGLMVCGCNEEYIGFTAADLSGNIIYVTDGRTAERMVFHQDGTLDRYTNITGISHLYAGRWTIDNRGMLVVMTPDGETSSYSMMLADDTDQKIYLALRYATVDGGQDMDVLWMFYSQETGLDQVIDFLRDRK